jgi:hypothetical protein
MASVVLNGSVSGSCTITAPSAAGTTTLTLPTTTSTLAINGPAFSAYQSSGQTGISSLTYTKITFTTEEFDTNSNFASSTFTPTVAGYYQVNAQVGITTATTNTTLLTAIYKNGSVAKSGSVSTGSTYLYPQSNASAIIYCNGSTDYIEIYVLGTAGGSSFGIYTGLNNTFFQAALIRSA